MKFEELNKQDFNFIFLDICQDFIKPYLINLKVILILKLTNVVIVNVQYEKTVFFYNPFFYRVN